MYAESENKFFLKIVDAQIEFVKDEKGAVAKLILHQSGRNQEAVRVSDKVQERTEISLPAELLAAYVGTYELRPGFDLVVTLEGGHLMTQATGQPKVPLFAESQTKFFLKAVDA